VGAKNDRGDDDETRKLVLGIGMLHPRRGNRRPIATLPVKIRDVITAIHVTGHCHTAMPAAIRRRCRGS